MRKNFKDNILLTSQTPHNFAIFSLENEDEDFYVIPLLQNNIDPGKLYLNGVDVNDFVLDGNMALKMDTNQPNPIDDATFHITSLSNEDFDASIKFLLYEDASLTSFNSEYSCNILNRPYVINEGINTYSIGKQHIEDETSYLVLRSNPKFTGNIKLIADSENNIYLDTFKVSDILSRKKYRKKQISPESTFAHDVRNVFSDLPEGELYKIGRDDILNIETPKTEYVKQYDTNYNYGARVFDDKLYDESFSSLAPLWINEELPDYYAIFKIDGPKNDRLSNLAQKYIQNGEIIKSWGLKDNTKLGKYLRNHISEMSNIRSPLFLSLSDPRSNNPDPNTWYGVAVNRGIITGRSETPYFFDKKTDNFTDMNAFLSEGFERNNLLCPNLINLEFLFEDEDSPLYEMNRYFGLYLTENKLYEVIYYREDSSVNVISIDNKSVDNFFNSDVFDSSGNIDSQYSNRIFSINDINNIKRINNIQDIDGSNTEEISSWINKPGNNILTTEVEDVSTSPFVSFNLKRVLKQGEHLRIIDKNNNKIWEAYGISYEKLPKGESWSYAIKNERDGYPTIYQTVFSVDGNIEDQVKAIESAFKTFLNHEDAPFEPYIRKDNGLSIVLNDRDSTDFYFQRITGNIKKDTIFEGKPKDDDIELFGVISPNNNDVEILSYDASYGPINFEFFGDRRSITVNFIEQENYYFYSIDKEYEENLKQYMYYYDASNKEYKLFESFIVNTEETYNKIYVDDPTSLEDRILLKTKYPIQDIDGLINLYDVYPLTISLLGINPVKDLDYKVYDASLGYKNDFNRNEGYKSEQWYKREDDKKTYITDILNNQERIFTVPSFYEIYQGYGTIKDLESGDLKTYNADVSTFKFNTFDGNIKITSGDVLTKVRKTYLKDDKEYYSYRNEYSEEDILDYYQDPSALLKYSLTIPYVTKWSLLGDNVRGNNMRLLLDSSAFEYNYNSPSNFIPFDDAFSDEISYPIFKYNNPGETAWKNYVYYDIFDVIDYKGENITLYDLMFQEPYLDVFSKYLYYSNTDDIKIRSSKVYYSDFKRSVDTIINGLSLSMSVRSFATNILNINDWDRYRFSFISSPSVSRTTNYPIEVIINENTQTILMIWYQGSDDLNFSRKGSNFTLPKGLIENDENNVSFNGPLDSSIDNYFIKSPFLVRTNNVNFQSFNKYTEGDIYTIRFDASVASPLSQFNIHLGSRQEKSVFNLFRDAYVNSNNYFEITSGIYPFSSYNTFDPSGYVSYGFAGFAPSYKTGITKNVAFTYKHKENYYKDKTCDFKDLDYILSNNLVSYNIIRGNVAYNNSSFINKPITINVNKPRKYTPEELDTSLGIYTYNGWLKPIFKDIFKFSTNEDNYLKNIFGKDFIVSNTNLKDYNNISQFWYNMIVNEVTHEDVSRGNAINFLPEFNIFKSSWDDNFYILNKYNTDGNLIRESVDGYISSKDIPSFFGSRLIKIPESLKLNSWDELNTNLIENEETYTLEYNITNAVSNIFKNEKIFTDNWIFGRSNPNLINNYINDTILNYYRININSIDVSLATKNLTNNDNILSFEQGNRLFQDDKNITTSLNYRNDQYFYQITVNKNLNLSYYTIFEIFRK